MATEYVEKTTVKLELDANEFFRSLKNVEKKLNSLSSLKIGKSNGVNLNAANGDYKSIIDYYTKSQKDLINYQNSLNKQKLLAMEKITKQKQQQARINSFEKIVKSRDAAFSKMGNTYRVLEKTFANKSFSNLGISI